MPRRSSGSPAPAVIVQSAESLSDTIYDTIRELIISNKLSSGQRLADRALSEQLGVSRTPVREALARLVATGLVVLAEDHGYRVAEVDLERARELYELRTMLEVEAIRLCCRRALRSTFEELDLVQKQIEDLRAHPELRAEEIRVGIQIHHIIARGCGNRELEQTLRRILDQMHSFAWIESLNEDPEASRKSHLEHEAIILSVKSGDEAAACAAMRTHIENAATSILRMFRVKQAYFGASLRGI